MSDMRDDLLDIQGVGEATADKIIEVYDNSVIEDIDSGVTEICGRKTESGFCTYPASDCPDHVTGDVPDEVHQALDYLDADRPGYAAKYLQQLVGD